MALAWIVDVPAGVASHRRGGAGSADAPVADEAVDHPAAVLPIAIGHHQDRAMPRGRARADSGRCGRGIAARAAGAEGAADDGADGASMAGEVVAELIRIGNRARLEMPLPLRLPSAVVVPPAARVVFSLVPPLPA